MHPNQIRHWMFPLNKSGEQIVRERRPLEKIVGGRRPPASPLDYTPDQSSNNVSSMDINKSLNASFPITDIFPLLLRIISNCSLVSLA